MNSAPSKLYSDDVSLLDANPFFWGGGNSSPHHPAATLPFSKFFNNVIPFLNSILLLNQLNHVVLIATGVSSCGYIYDSGPALAGGGKAPALCAEVLCRLEEFVAADRRRLGKGPDRGAAGSAVPSLLSGSLSLALCYIQRIFRSGALHPQLREHLFMVTGIMGQYQFLTHTKFKRKPSGWSKYIGC